MLIAILSDSHDNWKNLSQAVQIANNRGCSHLLHAGDIISPPMLEIIKDFRGQAHLVLGNNDAEIAGLIAKTSKYNNLNLEGLINGNCFENEIDGLKIFMNHYPQVAKPVAESGKFDLCIFGHTHQFYTEQIGSTTLLNPGELMGYVTGQAGFVIFDTQSREAEKVMLE